MERMQPPTRAGTSAGNPLSPVSELTHATQDHLHIHSPSLGQENSGNHNSRNSRRGLKRDCPDEDEGPRLRALSEYHTQTSGFALVRRNLHDTGSAGSSPRTSSSARCFDFSESSTESYHSLERSSSATVTTESRHILPRQTSEPINFMDDPSQRPVLPTLSEGSHADFHCISPGTLAAAIRGEYRGSIKRIIIYDCRFAYEYEGGHIKGAQLFEEKDVEGHIKTPIRHRDGLVIVFHCEFSSQRAPKLCRFLRSMDRNAHKHSYPELFYPQMYILEGGYKAFFESHSTLCEPQIYVTMKDKRYKEQCTTGLATLQRTESWNARRRGRDGSPLLKRSMSVSCINLNKEFQRIAQEEPATAPTPRRRCRPMSPLSLMPPLPPSQRHAAHIRPRAACAITSGFDAFLVVE